MTSLGRVPRRGLTRARSDRQGIQDDMERVEDLLHVLGEHRYQLGWPLKGERQMLLIPRAQSCTADLRSCLHSQDRDRCADRNGRRVTGGGRYDPRMKWRRP